VKTRLTLAALLIALLGITGQSFAQALDAPSPTYDTVGAVGALGDRDDASDYPNGNQACRDRDWNNCIDPSCVNPGNPNGICWYSGYQFQYRTICMEMVAYPAYWDLAAAVNTMNWVAAQWAVNGPRIYNRSTSGGCAADGFAPGQIVKIEPYAADDGHCGYALPPNYGYHAGVVRVKLNMSPNYPGGWQYASSCRSGAAWNKLVGHEFGHTLGYSHYAEPESLMSAGLYRSSIDAWKNRNVYTDNPVGDPLCPTC
jgi:hypothetical protein